MNVDFAIKESLKVKIRKENLPHKSDKIQKREKFSLRLTGGLRDIKHQLGYGVIYFGIFSWYSGQLEVAIETCNTSPQKNDELRGRSNITWCLSAPENVSRSSMRFSRNLIIEFKSSLKWNHFQSHFHCNFNREVSNCSRKFFSEIIVLKDFIGKLKSEWHGKIKFNSRNCWDDKIANNCPINSTIVTMGNKVTEQLQAFEPKSLWKINSTNIFLPKSITRINLLILIRFFPLSYTILEDFILINVWEFILIISQLIIFLY